MKKYLMGTFALMLAIGFSAFTAEKKEATPFNPVYWFYVESGAGAEGTFTNATVSFAAYSTNPPSLDCSGTGNKCVVNFNPADLTIITPGVEAELDDNGGASAKTPINGGYERGAP